MKYLLSFCIPTWNRADILDEALCDLIPKIRETGFLIVIANNASTDHSQQIIEKHQALYPHIVCFTHQHFYEGDHNFEFVLAESAKLSRYSWLLGDSYRIKETELPAIIELLEKDLYKVVILNAVDRIKGLPSRAYQSSTLLLKDLGWHMTMMATLIFVDELIESAPFYRYYNSNFIQNGIIFEHLNKFPKSQVYWNERNCIGFTQKPKKGTSWHSSTLQVFAQNWSLYILSLPPQIDLSIKLECIKKHNVKCGLLSLNNLYDLKRNDWLDYQRDVLPYKQYIPIASITPWWMFFIVSVSPYPIAILIKFPLKGIEKIYRLFTNYKELKR